MLKALALTIIGAVLSLPGAVGAQRPAQSFYVGDSIGAIMQEYGFLSYDVIDSVPGRPLQEGIGIVQGFNLHRGDTLVVELGSNNLNDSNIAPLIASMLSVVPDDVCMQWVVPQNFWTPSVGAKLAGALAAGIAADQQCATLVRWDLLGGAWMTYDLVHPTYEGAWYLASLIQPSTEPLWL